MTTEPLVGLTGDVREKLLLGHGCVTNDSKKPHEYQLKKITVQVLGLVWVLMLHLTPQCLLGSQRPLWHL